jgi:hypothetical protein
MFVFFLPKMAKKKDHILLDSYVVLQNMRGHPQKSPASEACSGLSC